VNILSMTAHSIEEYDMVRMFTDLGHDVFSPGAYMVPSDPQDDMRPALPDAPHHPDLAAIVNGMSQTHEHGPTWAVKSNLPPEFLEWADVVMIHHALEQWLYPQWPKLKASGKRIIWRTVGQSGHENEWVAQTIVRDGLEVVRYSPRESVIPNFAGEDTMIRFYKDPDEYVGWHGQDRRVLIVTQNPVKRQNHVGTSWMLEATKNLPVRIIGPQTEDIGGEGKVSPAELMEAMRSCRVMLYTGTIPASYTLGLIEAMMTGMPVVAIGPQAWSWPTKALRPYAPRLYEGHAIAPLYSDSPSEAHDMLEELLADSRYAEHVGAVSRERAIALFAKDRVYKAWQGWLEDKTQPDPEPDELPDVATREVV
jgi:glycosyltransferase involved in cell wall biosynthesis